jgi:L-amino acid N-acyltransferase YncA
VKGSTPAELSIRDAVPGDSVAIDGSGTLLGWASLNSFSPRAAYDPVADISVHVARDARCRVSDGR